MYQYRRMTPEERAQELMKRRIRGFPLHAPPHLEQGEGNYLLTAACFEHQHFFDEPALLTWLQDTILELFDSKTRRCLAWVFLPTHYHLLTYLDCELREISEIIRKAHGRIATKLNGWQKTRKRRIWNNFADRKIRYGRHYWTTLNYIHGNPVKHGYVEHLRDWPWSSWHEYQEQFGEEWLQEIWQAYPIHDYGKGWDW